MLEMREECQRCGTGLPADTSDARICSYKGIDFDVVDFGDDDW